MSEWMNSMPCGKRSLAAAIISSLMSMPVHRMPALRKEAEVLAGAAARGRGAQVIACLSSSAVMNATSCRDVAVIVLYGKVVFGEFMVELHCAARRIFP